MFNPRLRVAALLVLATALPASAQVGFADDQPDRLRLWNATHYEIALRKSDGRALSIHDQTTGGQVSPGNVHGPWVLRFADGTWLDGESFSPTDPARRFSYAWNAQDQVLTLDYVATGTHACQVTLTMLPTDGPEIDSVLSVTNQSAVEIELAAYPVHLAFLHSDVEAAYVPHMEGMRLLPGFFTAHDFGSRYPGQMFGDFAFTQLDTGAFAVYAVHDPQDPLPPVQWLILRDTFAGGVSKFHRDYTLTLAPAQTWVSPVITLSIGSDLAEAMDDYWTRNGHDTIPTLEQKLGTELFERLAAAVLLKADFRQVGTTFDGFAAVADTLPAGNLLHLVNFWPVGFDEHYPDYLPPDPALGTLAELQDLVAQAQADGHLVMPYTNPTWWDDQGPTLANLGTGIVARDRGGNLIYETYNGRGGYVVSPHDPDVIARQDQTRDEFTLTLPCDLLFEDQVGARAAPTFGDHAAAPDPLAYTQGLVDLAERSATWLPILSEGGYDRLARHESGFCLSQTVGWHTWPDSTFRPYPLVPLWARETMVFMPHNLAGAAMATDLPTLTYYLSIGYSLSCDLSATSPDWLSLLDCFQKVIVAPRVGVAMTSFVDLPTDGRTQTTFADGAVLTANLTATPLASGGHVVAPDGFLLEQGGRVLGGVLRSLHGQSLAGSDPHFIAFEYEDWRTTVFQPIGADGDLTLPRPAAWTDDARIVGRLTTEDGATQPVSVQVDPTTLTLTWLATVGGQGTRSLALVYCRPGDADCDGRIDVGDLAAFADCLAGPDLASGPTPPTTAADCRFAFDVDGDQDVDLRDFLALQRSAEEPR